MAKNKLTDWSSTAASNTDIGSIGIEGSNQRSNFDDAFREGMAQIAKVNAGTDPVADTWSWGNSSDLTRKFRFSAAGISAGASRVFTMPNYDGTLATLAGTETLSNKTFDGLTISGTATGTLLTITSTEAGASAGPDLELYRDSASPAASDIIGGVLFYGEDSAGNKELYGSVRSTIIDHTSASEDGEVTIRTVGAGTVADRLHVRLGAYMEGATGTDKGAGTFNATALYVNGSPVGMTVETQQATSSGTSKDFTSIPSTVRRITIMINFFSQNGAGIPMIQIGDSGGIETSGYAGSVSGTTAGSDSSANHSSGFLLASGSDAADVVHGIGTLVNTAGNIWIFSWNGSLSNEEYTFVSAGTKALTATLDRVRLTTDTGTTFDGGGVNIFYE